MSKASETTEMLMRRLAAGLVSWLTFQQVAFRSRMYSERFVYTPIFELASARGWRADHEFSVKLSSEKFNRRVDFVFSLTGTKQSRSDKIAALEIKYVSQEDKRKASEIENIILDEKKLKKLDNKKINKGIHAPLDRYIMLVAKEKSLKALCRKARTMKVRHLKKYSLLTRVESVLNSEDRKDLGEPLGEIFYSPFNYKALWCVMILFIPGR